MIKFVFEILKLMDYLLLYHHSAEVTQHYAGHCINVAFASALL